MTYKLTHSSRASPYMYRAAVAKYEPEILFESGRKLLFRQNATTFSLASAHASAVNSREDLFTYRSHPQTAHTNTRTIALTVSCQNARRRLTPGNAWSPVATTQATQYFGQQLERRNAGRRGVVVHGRVCKRQGGLQHRCHQVRQEGPLRLCLLTETCAGEARQRTRDHAR